MDIAPIFITGYERSGTTLVRRIMSMCPALEYDLIHEGAGLLKFRTPEDAFENYRMRVTQQGITYDAWASVKSGEKLPYGITLKFVKQYVQRWKSWWPESTILHVVRDCKDVARSCRKTFNRADNSYIIVERVTEFREFLEQFDNVHAVSYDGLVERPLESIRWLYDLIGVNADMEHVRKVFSTREPWMAGDRLMCGLRYKERITR